MKTVEIKGQDKHATVIDLEGVFGNGIEKIPYVLRLLIENHIRSGGSIDGLQDAVRHQNPQSFDLVFRPNRILMHDTTATPALTDLAAMRDVLAENGEDPHTLNPVIPVHISVDHSLAVNAFARRDALQINSNNELRRNRERYAFLKWASNSFDNMTVFPPGTGIMHTINLEQLSTIVVTNDDGLTHPDMMLGTDSHTPMVNGIGVLAWGIGGLEAESVMLGDETTLVLPEVVGVHLTGELANGVLSTDLALELTSRLRDLDVTGSFVEFVGPGVTSLRAEDRAVIANMAPEYGATTGYFPVDDETLSYMKRIGRAEQNELIKSAFKTQCLWHRPNSIPKYQRSLHVDLSEIRPSIAGPRRPQDRLEPAFAKQAVEKAIGRKIRNSDGDQLPDGAIGIAAITSCTNTSDPRLLVTAGLLARKARERGLRSKPWVKTSFAPGSPATIGLLRRAHLLDDLSQLGFDIVGFGCTTCIGNSGDLPQIIEDGLNAEKAVVAVLSGNRNFPGRVHPKLSLGYLCSPALVIAYAIKGTIRGNILKDRIGHDKYGYSVKLSEIWPTDDEVSAHLERACRPSDVSAAFNEALNNKNWSEIEAADDALFPWSEQSRILRSPVLVRQKREVFRKSFRAKPLLVLGDDITTDHISPAGWIAPNSLAGRWLLEKGADPKDLNVYASYRGNWEVMIRGLFTNRLVVNYLDTSLPPGTTKTAIHTEPISLMAAAKHYEDTGQSTIVLAGERYGMGSSRDWAAKGVSLLGVKAAVAKSFERIHRTNLIAMGIAPVRINSVFVPESCCVGPSDDVEILFASYEIVPFMSAEVRIHDRGSTKHVFYAYLDVHTEHEAWLLESGGTLPAMLERLIRHEV